MPIPWVARARTFWRMSSVVFGSTAANGSSSRMSNGSQTRHRAISSRRFSPPEPRAAAVRRDQPADVEECHAHLIGKRGRKDLPEKGERGQARVPVPSSSDGGWGGGNGVAVDTRGGGVVPQPVAPRPLRGQDGRI